MKTNNFLWKDNFLLVEKQYKNHLKSMKHPTKPMDFPQQLPLFFGCRHASRHLDPGRRGETPSGAAPAARPPGTSCRVDHPGEHGDREATGWIRYPLGQRWEKRVMFGSEVFEVVV